MNAVAYWGHPLSAQISKAAIGTMDAWMEPEVYDIPDFKEIEEYDREDSPIGLEVDMDKFRIRIKDKYYDVKRDAALF